jgi:GNAT superfamily N-acetyltransferase
MPRIHVQNVYIEGLKSRHNLKDFQSSNIDLKKFLEEDALHNQEHCISTTFLLFYESELVSYISLLVDRITLTGDIKESFENKDIYYNTIPALKIGRMCVDDRFQRKGIGKLMLKLAFRKARNMNVHTGGCRFLTVNAKNESVEFYKKFGFKKIKKRKDSTTMRLDIKLTQQN